MIRIKELRKQKKITQKELANYLQIADSTLSYWEQGKYEPDNDSLKILADYFKVSIDYLLGRPAGDFFSLENISPITTKKIPLLGAIAAGQPIFSDEGFESYVEVGAEVQADFCLRVIGDSMINARIQDGDIVFIHQQSIVDNGTIAAVVIDDEATLKRVYYYPDKEKLVLQAENPKYEPFVYSGEELNEIQVLGKAVAFQSDIK